MEKQDIALLVNEVNSFTPCSINRDYEKLSDLITRIINFSLHFTKVQQKKIIAAIRMSAELHRGQYRLDKTTPYIIHPLETAVFGIEIGRATYRKLIVAALHDVVEDENNGRNRTIIRKQIRKAFGYACSEEVAIITKHRHPAREARFYINLRETKNLIHRAEAIEVKFWDRIKNAETFDVFPKEKRRLKIEETMREFPILASELTKTLTILEKKGKLSKKADKFVAVKLLDYLSKAMAPHL